NLDIVNLIEAVLMFLSRNKHPESPLNEMHDLFSPISSELFASGGSALIECIIGPDEACASRFLQWRPKVSEVTSSSQPEWQNWIRRTHAPRRASRRHSLIGGHGSRFYQLPTRAVRAAEEGTLAMIRTYSFR